MEKENVFKKMLDSSDLSLKELNEFTGIDCTELNEYYKGKKISILHAKKIADVFDIQVSELYGFEDGKTKAKKEKKLKTETVDIIQPSTEEDEISVLKAENKLLKETLLRLIILLQ